MLGLLANKNTIILVVVVLLAGYIFYLRSSVETLALQKSALESSLQISNASVDRLSLSIDEQNAAVEKLKTAADERTLRFLDEIAAAKSASTTYKKQAADLLRRSAPQNISKCDAANQLLVEEIANAK